MEGKGKGIELSAVSEKDVTINWLTQEECKELEEVYQTIGRPAYIQVDLDAVDTNLQVFRECASNPKIGVIASVKANAYGHGAVPLALHLKSTGVDRLGVATLEEAFQLRQAEIEGPIHVFGNLQAWELPGCIEYNLISTMSSIESVIDMAKVLKHLDPKRALELFSKYKGKKVGSVHVKVDTGMSMNGCQPEELPSLIKLCLDLDVPVEGIFTNLVNYEDAEFTMKQMNLFNAAIEPYREMGILFHVANSGGILTGVGTNLDLMRVGRGLYGLTPVSDLDRFTAKGLKPSASVHAQAVLVRRLAPGAHVGYGGTFVTDQEEWIVTLPVGYADFYPRALSDKGVVIRQRTGERCRVTGKVTADIVTVRVRADPKPIIGESFTLLTADYDEQTSLMGIANITNTSPTDITMAFQQRLPKYYTKDSKHCMLWSLTSKVDSPE